MAARFARREPASKGAREGDDDASNPHATGKQ